ncbi:hypothetical protein DAEQUDRAFT_728265 [Daedalea quercina L-15889]|uniref:Uncharacterized protein n=1 Tax=Daedalea quercina L-15889 TaxID=1314783 RepID=A0A165PHE6_9APHY|nr:hypothetical protein DAEQUDRAFT_728265 [Daedalea quercina L-15889]
MQAVQTKLNFFWTFHVKQPKSGDASASTETSPDSLPSRGLHSPSLPLRYDPSTDVRPHEYSRGLSFWVVQTCYSVYVGRGKSGGSQGDSDK